LSKIFLKSAQPFSALVSSSDLKPTIQNSPHDPATRTMLTKTIRKWSLLKMGC